MMLYDLYDLMGTEESRVKAEGARCKAQEKEKEENQLFQVGT